MFPWDAFSFPLLGCLSRTGLFPSRFAPQRKPAPGSLPAVFHPRLSYFLHGHSPYTVFFWGLYLPPEDFFDLLVGLGFTFAFIIFPLQRTSFPRRVKHPSRTTSQKSLPYKDVFLITMIHLSPKFLPFL